MKIDYKRSPLTRASAFVVIWLAGWIAALIISRLTAAAFSAQMNDGPIIFFFCVLIVVSSVVAGLVALSGVDGL